MIAGVVLLIGLAMIFLAKKRRFDRLNKYGREAFPSYFAKLVSRTIDELLFLVGVVVAVWAGFVLLSDYASDWVWLSVIIGIAVAIEHLLLSDRRATSHVKVMK